MSRFEASPDEIKDLLEMVGQVDNVVKIIKANRIVYGHMNCPRCNKELGIVYSVAPNGHTRGNCLTPGCLSWIE